MGDAPAALGARSAILASCHSSFLGARREQHKTGDGQAESAEKSYSILIMANLLEHNSKSNECENVEAPSTSVQLATMS